VLPLLKKAMKISLRAEQIIEIIMKESCIDESN